MSKILVVDDTAANRDLVVSLLRHRGHEALEAGDGLEALRLVRQERPALVISDILMPVMDGYEFVRELRADPAIAQTDVIFFTAFYREREAKKLAEACGVRRVLTKPAEPEDILRAIDEVLHGEGTPELQPIVEEFDREHLRLVTDKLSEKVSELQASNQRFAALCNLNLRLASERDPHELLGNVCRGARDLIGSKVAILAVRRDGDISFFSAGIASDLADRLAIPDLETGVFRDVMAGRVSRRMGSPNGTPLQLGLPENHPKANSALIVPVASLDAVYGWICLLDRAGTGSFSEEDESLLGILSSQVGRIFENGQLYLQVRRHADELRESEARFRQLAENIREVFFLVDSALNRTLYVSPAFEDIWGRPRESVYNRSDAWTDAIHPDDVERARLVMEEGSRKTGQFDHEFRIVRPDGTIRWIRSRGFPIRDATGTVYRIAGIADDITSRKQAETRIRRLNRVHAVLSGINGLIVRVHDRQELFAEACRIAVQQGKFLLAWIGLVEASRREVLPVASAGNDVPFLSHVHIPLVGASADSLSLVASSILTGEPVVCNDIAMDPRAILYREEMLARGYRSIATLPLTLDSLAIGCIALYSNEKEFFDDDEMRLLVELAGDISFALDHLNKADQLNYVAYYDTLTGLANRRLFLERLSQQIHASERKDRKVAVIVTDVERLKAVNDSLGRHAGDQLLMEIGGRFASRHQAGVEVARVGSDEFAAIIDDFTDETDVLRTLDHWERSVFGDPFTIDRTELRITARTGIAVYPDDATSPDAMLHNAEAALERSKGSEHRYLFYTQEMTERLTNRLRIESMLQTALQNEEFQLHYQAKVDVETRSIVGVEALIRWLNPELGLVMPLDFIPLLEETGMILDVGAWALERATRDYNAWVQITPHPPRIAVNVSTVQLRSVRFVDDLRDILAASPARTGIDLEITESRFMDNVLDNIAKLDHIRSLGVNVAIDDFGTAYSSLSYLARLPLQALKIDRAFVQTMLEDPDTMTLVSTIISLAHSLRLLVIAEGVESEDQARILRLLRCDHMQGFLIGRPVPFDEMTDLLRTSAAP